MIKRCNSFCHSETYLLLAEALVNASQENAAVLYISGVRTRAAYAGKEADMEITEGDVSIDFILDERVREFYGEQKRWFDLKRTGKLIERNNLHNLED